MRTTQIERTGAPLEPVQPLPAEPLVCSHEAGALRDVRLFQARIADAVDAAAHRLFADIAADVLGRELTCAPPDLQRIVHRALRG